MKRKIFFFYVNNHKKIVILPRNEEAQPLCLYMYYNRKHINTMKKTLFIVTALALLLAACGGSGTDSSHTVSTTDSTGSDGSHTASAPAYHYTEPKDSIVRIIWNKVKEEDPAVKRVIAAAVKLNTVPQSKAENFTSKTQLDYRFECFTEWDNDYNPLVAYYQLQCYQMLDSSWIAVLDQRIDGSKVDSKDCGSKISVVKYKDGVLSFPDYKTFFPRQIRTVELVNSITSARKRFLFDNLGIRFCGYECWPLQFTWNGSTFDCDSKEIVNRINCYHYNIDTYDKTIVNFLLGHKYTYSPDKVFKSKDGTILLKLDVSAGISQGEKCDVLAGYTVVDSSVGMVTESDYDKDNDITFISQEPIALGYPIKNVLNTKWSRERESDSSLTKETKDGKLYLTYKKQSDKRDYYLEFVAKDENSNIESIRVYSEPFAVDIKEELGKCKDKSNRLKEIFNALDYKFVAPEFGEFNYVNCYGGSDGVALNFWGKTNAYFQIMDVEGKTLVVLSRETFDDSKFSYKDSFWYYEDGKFTPTEFSLPPTSYKGKLTDVRRTFEGNSLMYEVGYPDDEEGEYFYEHFFWDGEKFEKQ